MAARPLPQHRQSIPPGSPSAAIARQSSHSRNHSHSALSGALNPTHRITRRKSMTNSGANLAAVAAALTEAGDEVTPLPIAINSRRGTISKSAAARSAVVGSLPSPPASLPAHRFMNEKMDGQDTAIDDDSNDMSADEGEAGFNQSRVRRASDGQPLTKEGKKSNRVELRCDKWEHTPEWSYTSKLLISKHQQVQLLEAASVLVAMNTKDTPTPPESAKDFASEADSSSPAASGYSEQPNGQSSVDTTPPPQTEALPATNTLAYRGPPNRYSSGSYSLSYQSAASGSFFPGSVSSGTGFGHNRHGSSDHRRPPSSGRNNTGQEDRDLAAAVELLSCSFNSSGVPRDIRLPEGAPPVPPLPTQYLDQAVFTSTSFINSYQAPQMPESFTRGESLYARNVKREESEDSIMGDDDDDGHRRYRARGSDDDDEMMFGRMED
ncbi:hypothetical protein DL769_001430 [Monosporascus sp. CRB-8-3]|nr:hypothetical protein DL769_001430 [Monosporascus sp. CRB-8-3]